MARELQQKYSDLYASIAQDPDIRGLVTRLQDPNYKAASSEEEEQIEAFCLLLGSIWLSTGSAYAAGQIDSAVYQVYFDDVEAKLTKWPGLRPYFVEVIERYPSSKSFEIIGQLFE